MRKSASANNKIQTIQYYINEHLDGEKSVYKFSEKSMQPYLRTCVDKIMSTDGR